MGRWRTALGVVALAGTLGAARPADAGYLEDAGWGGLTVLTNVFYMPAKLIYATVGGVTGGFVYAVTAGDLQAAENVWVMSMGGTYVVTPRMLQGEDPIAFAGTPSTDTSTTADGAGNGLQEEQLTGRPLGGT